MERIERIDELLIRMFKKWIEVQNPVGCYFNTSGGSLTAEEILKQIEQKTEWGIEFRIVIKTKYLGMRIGSKGCTSLSSEELIYIIIEETMRRLEILSGISQK
jgi:hypothetical protein